MTAVPEESVRRGLQKPNWIAVLSLLFSIGVLAACSTSVSGYVFYSLSDGTKNWNTLHIGDILPLQYTPPPPLDLGWLPVFEHTGGVNDVAEDLYLGPALYYDLPTLVGFYNLDGADAVLHVGGSEYIAGCNLRDPMYYSTYPPVPSHFEQKNGTHQVNHDFSLGITPNGDLSYGTYTLSGGSMGIGRNACLNWDWMTLCPNRWSPQTWVINPVFTQSGQSTLTIGGNLTCLQWFDLQGGCQTITGNLMIGQANDPILSDSAGGIYTMSGGSLSVGGNETIVGYQSYLPRYSIRNAPPVGSFTQSGGSHEVNGDLYLGKFSNDSNPQNGTQALYTMNGTNTTLTVKGNEYILGCPVPDFGSYPANRVTSFIHSNGSHIVQGDLYIGYDPAQVGADGQYQAGHGMGYGLYQLSQGTLQVGGDLYLGQYCHAVNDSGDVLDQVPALTQRGTSTITIVGSLISAGPFSVNSSQADMNIGQDLIGGWAQIQAGRVQVGGRVQTSGWSQTGGVATVGGDFTSNGNLSVTNDGELHIGGNLRIDQSSWSFGWGTNGGQLTVGGSEFIEGRFEYGGTHTIQNNLVIGTSMIGQYLQEMGTLIVGGNMYLGANPSGQNLLYGGFYQYGGTTVINGSLYLDSTSSTSTWVNEYNLWSGRLSTTSAFVGTQGPSRLSIGTTGELFVTDELSVGPYGTLVGQGTIHMTGSSFSFEVQADPQNPALADPMKSLTFIIEGGNMTVETFEVAGMDLGATLSGFDGNFSLGALVLGGTNVGQLQLVDAFDNQPGWAGREALYVHTLNLGAGSTIDLNGLNLYYIDGLIDPTAIIDLNGGQLIQIPEPVAVSLFIVGGPVFFRRRWNSEINM